MGFVVMGVWNLLVSESGNGFRFLSVRKSVLVKGHVVIRFWKLCGSLFLQNMDTVSCKRGFGVGFIEVKRAYDN